MSAWLDPLFAVFALDGEGLSVDEQFGFYGTLYAVEGLPVDDGAEVVVFAVLAVFAE
ncbi:hypothetical protein EVA_18008 [gut metagenome]|uniref:Uncharacterized protein n=1 Tax=gut metagenome TaxID=749906 RepID=J9C232_9ZZZZ